MIVFECPYKCKKQLRSLSRPHTFQKRSLKKSAICRIKLDFKNIKFQLLQLKFNASKFFNTNIHKVQKNQTLVKAHHSFLKTWLFLFLGHFVHTLTIIAFNIKRFSACFFVYMTLHRKKLNGTCTFIIQSSCLIG